MLMNIIVWIIVGAIAGWLAGAILKSRNSLIMNIIIGIIGSFIGGFVLTLIPDVQAVDSGLSIGHILTATLGAVILLLVLRFIRK